MSSPMGKSGLMIGPGFIGWNVMDLLVAERYPVTGLVRHTLHKLRARSQVIAGDFDDKTLISE